MIQCQNCNKANVPESQFCRYCGMRLSQQQPVNQSFQPPRPYAWKSDEYQLPTDARSAAVTSDHVFTPNQEPNRPPSYLELHSSYRGPQDLTGRYRCPTCGTNYLPVMERRISPAGWVTFALLLVFTLVFFWIGLLIKENVMICPVCKQRVR